MNEILLNERAATIAVIIAFNFVLLIAGLWAAKG